MARSCARSASWNSRMSIARRKRFWSARDCSRFYGVGLTRTVAVRLGRKSGGKTAALQKKPLARSKSAQAEVLVLLAGLQPSIYIHIDVADEHSETQRVLECESLLSLLRCRTHTDCSHEGSIAKAAARPPHS